MTDAQTELKPQGDLIFALDVGTRTVIGLLGEKLGDDGFKLLDYELEPHERRAMSDGQVEDISLTAKTVRTVCERLSKKTGIRLQKAAVAAAGRDLRTVRVKKQFDIAAKETITAEDIKLMETDAMQSAQKGLDKSGDGSELYYCVGYSAAGYELDGKSIINLLSHKGQTAGIELIVAFLPNMVVNGLYQTANDAGLKVSALTLEPIAAANLLLPYERRFLNIALADIGAGTSDIAVVRDYKIVGYEMATVAGDEITEKIMQEYFVDFDDAEAMKLQTGENIEYRDIFSFPQIAPRKEFMSKITDSVQTLATSIASAIKQVNGDMPGAAYLAGGGSMIEGLPEAVAEGLGVDKNRVQVARREMFRGVDIGNFQLGAQFVTPLGIALTAARGEGYDFSMILVNDHKVNIFDTHTVPLMELLRSAGYKLTDIMGRNGRSLMFYVNGQQKQIKGGIFTPAVIEVNDVVCSIDQTATQGDRVKFTPAINGESAKATLSELFGDMEDYIFRVNGEEVSTDYKIQSMDKIDAEHISQTAPTEIAEHQEHHEQHHEQHSAQPDIDDDDIDDTDEIENTDE
ncbi:MAG: pilus assembly protein PilM, partial [Oscillospiraceae bacterium]|nr:pilus assembly protein PilM [Oscillospiraceae bacterium]